jgi:hypothetical protein
MKRTQSISYDGRGTRQVVKNERHPTSGLHSFETHGAGVFRFFLTLFKFCFVGNSYVSHFPLPPMILISLIFNSGGGIISRLVHIA